MPFTTPIKNPYKKNECKNRVIKNNKFYQKNIHHYLFYLFIFLFFYHLIISSSHHLIPPRVMGLKTIKINGSQLVILTVKNRYFL